MGNAYFAGDHVFYEGKWFLATDHVSQAVVPVNPENLLPFSQFIPYSSGDVLLGGGFTPLIARQLMKGTWNPNQSYQSGDVVQLNNSYHQLNDKHLGNWNPNLIASMGETVYYNGIFYRSSQSSAGSYLDPASDSVIWQQLGSILDSPGIMDVTNSVQVEATGFTGGMFFEVSPWKTLDQGGVSIGNPLHSGSFIDRTAMYTNLNSAMWRLSNSNSNSGDDKPMVSNISYSQRINPDGNRTKLVDIIYDLDGNRSMFVEFFFSYDGGDTFPVVCTAVSGDSGPGVGTGLGKTAFWDASQDWDQNFTNRGRIMVKATYGNQPTGYPGNYDHNSSGLDPANPSHTHYVPSANNLEMIWVEPGTFIMGSPSTEVGRVDSKEDQHEVTLTHGYYLGKFEVTQAQYQEVMTGNPDGLSATPSYFDGNPNRPVEQVSHDDIQVFLSQLNNLESLNMPAGWSYVLPTDAQWEYACRAGSSSAYSWGGDINSSRANYYDSNIGETSNVGNYESNPWGFYDMHGSVWEWTADWFQGSLGTSGVVDPIGPASGSSRVKRGGSWKAPPSSLRSAMRYDLNTPNRRYYSIGFRVAFQKQ